MKSATIHQLRPRTEPDDPSGTSLMPVDVARALHRLWDALENVTPEQTDYVKERMEHIWGVPGSVLDEVRSAKASREQAQKDLDDHPSPA